MCQKTAERVVDPARAPVSGQAVPEVPEGCGSGTVDAFRFSAAKIAVENTAYHFDKLFDYRIPDRLRGTVLPGCRVMIPFGAGNSLRQGMVLECYGGPCPEGLKEIVSSLDEKPLLSRELLSMVPWLKERYFCTLFEAAKLMLPAGISLRIRESFRLAKPLDELEESTFSSEEWKLLKTLSRRKKGAEREDLYRTVGMDSSSGALEHLLECGAAVRERGAVRQIGDATRRMVRLGDPESLPEKPTQKQREVIRFLQETGAASVKELCYYAGVTPSVVNGLAAKGTVAFYEYEIYRSPYCEAAEPALRDGISLSGEQQAAFGRLYRQYAEGKGGVSLLYGVTGSGKTSVFLRLIDEVYPSGRGIIVMVPEISLTPQTVSVFQKRYGNRVAVFHSGLSLAERLDEWKRVRRGEASIVVGTRSAVFAPFDDVGLIIMDEEQEYTYKSESSPRYHAREAAKFRCAWHKSLLVLSSATPSVESFYFAQAGRYTLNRLPQRYGKAELPLVEIVDMNSELEAGNNTVLSSRLVSALEENRRAGRQSIILLNRRGYNTFVSCRSCGYVAECPNCSITLTYHAANRRLMCHYCGYSVPFSETCPECRSADMRCAGSGTQRAEEQLREALPEARILRLDADTTMARFAYEKKLDSFARGEYDMIVGTQMVAKGLDFENVTLVGVLSADQSLYSDDFRSSERAFDLFTQVVGRAGRGKYSGRAIIQTFTPENPVIRLAACQDYESFYRGEIQFRRAMLYPPFVDIVVVGFVGAKESSVREASSVFLQMLRELAEKEYSELPLRVLSPSPAAVQKVSNKFRYKLIIKCRCNRTFREMLARLLVSFGARREFSSVTAFADCNPDHIM